MITFWVAILWILLALSHIWTDYLNQNYANLLFLSDSRGAVELARDLDVNALSGLVKLYFRELPEALFTDALYPQLVNAMGLSDPDSKEKCMLAIKNKLPEPNKTVVNYLLNHLIKWVHSVVI